MDGVAIAQNIMSTSLHQEIHRITDTEEHAREFLFQRDILKATMSCPDCSSPMTLVACSSLSIFSVVALSIFSVVALSIFFRVMISTANA